MTGVQTCALPIFPGFHAGGGNSAVWIAGPAMLAFVVVFVASRAAARRVNRKSGTNRQRLLDGETLARYGTSSV